MILVTFNVKVIKVNQIFFDIFTFKKDFQGFALFNRIKFNLNQIASLYIFIVESSTNENTISQK